MRPEGPVKGSFGLKEIKTEELVVEEVYLKKNSSRGGSQIKKVVQEFLKKSSVGM